MIKLVPTLEQFNEFYTTELNYEEQNILSELITATRKKYNLKRTSAYMLVYKFIAEYNINLIKRNDLRWKYKFINDNFNINEKSNYNKTKACTYWINKLSDDDDIINKIKIWSINYDRKHK